LWVGSAFFCLTHNSKEIEEEIKSLQDAHKESERVRNLPDDTFDALVEAHKIILKDTLNKLDKKGGADMKKISA